MAEEQTKRYHMSDMFISKLHKDILLNILIILVFFALFNVVFKDHPDYGVIRIALIVIFFIIGIAVIYSDVLRIKKYMSIYYQVGEKELIYFNGRKEKVYPWAHFTAVVVNRNRFSLMYPYEFRTKEGNFYLHPKIGEQEKLIPAILERVKEYAKIDPEIPEIFRPAKHF